MGQCIQHETSMESEHLEIPRNTSQFIWNPDLNRSGHGQTHVNSSTKVELSNRELDCQLYLFIIYVVLFGSMIVFGVIGNSLSFVVLNMDKRSHAATYLLQTMSLVDNSFLLTSGVSQILPAYSLYIEDRHYPHTPYLTKYVHPLVYITQLGTVWVTVLISFNRFIAICRPFQATKLCSMTRVRIQVTTVFILIILYNVPRFFEYCIDLVYDPLTNTTITEYRPSNLKQNRTYNNIYENIFYCLFVFLGPLVILIVLNTCLIRELIRSRRRLMVNQLIQRKASKSSRGEEAPEDQEQNITLVMIVIVLMFLFCQTPAYLNQLLYYVLGEEEYECGTAYFYYYHVSNLIVSANSALNFVIYCAFRKQFRARLRNLFGKRMRECCRGHFKAVVKIENGDAAKFNGKNAFYRRVNFET